MDKTNTVVVGGNNVQGDITSCDIKKIDSKHNISSIFSPVDNVTYITYNSCTKQVISTYSVPELREDFVVLAIVGGFVCVFLVYAILDFFHNL